MKRWPLYVMLVLVIAVLVLRETAVSHSIPLDITPSSYAYLPNIVKPLPTSTPTPTPTPLPGPDWLAYVNEFRLLAGLPVLTENDSWSYGGVLHSRYMVKEDEITHYENTASAWYTQEGYDAGRNGNVAVSSTTTASDEFAIDLWMTGPFHAVGILDPQLAQTGFGSYREAIGTWKMGATLDVLRGLGSLPPGITFPIYYPQDGGQAWLISYGGSESPDPLTSCPGYSAPSGPPIILQLGSGSVTPNVTSSSFSQGSTPLEHCIFDETNYVNPNSTYQSLGRSVLGGRDAVVIMPRSPLTVGQTYTASITANGTQYTWSFSVVNGRTSTQDTATWEIR
ncbi:MAG: CAP domain-containing protein [Ardenticatenaceae bacterium]|nr:CAP domain-containing protein [Anaerolineales bacterium]MCB8921569.1 CAP domain-containing protein [Ardenticatenaceae bacterium]MCB9003894.1 CAP domain-containing protein [Ardenticatenaceae bacterium]